MFDYITKMQTEKEVCVITIFLNVIEFPFRSSNNKKGHT